MWENKAATRILSMGISQIGSICGKGRKQGDFGDGPTTKMTTRYSGMYCSVHHFVLGFTNLFVQNHLLSLQAHLAQNIFGLLLLRNSKLKRALRQIVTVYIMRISMATWIMMQSRTALPVWTWG
jgi:hypothetical protein